MDAQRQQTLWASAIALTSLDSPYHVPATDMTFSQVRPCTEAQSGRVSQDTSAPVDRVTLLEDASAHLFASMA